MANSGIEWIDETFNFCVRLLYEIGGILGISYEEINVWLPRNLPERGLLQTGLPNQRWLL